MANLGGNKRQIHKLNHRHEQLINWMLMNPHRTMKEAAHELGYHPKWVYVITSSDAFQAAYREKADKLGEIVVHTAKDNLNAATNIALERVTERLIEGGFTEDFLAKSAAMLLKANGLGGESTVTQRHMHLHASVDPETLRRAREKAEAANHGTAPQKLISQAAPGLPANTGEGEDSQANVPAEIQAEEV